MPTRAISHLFKGKKPDRPPALRVDTRKMALRMAMIMQKMTGDRCQIFNSDSYGEHYVARKVSSTRWVKG